MHFRRLNDLKLTVKLESHFDLELSCVITVTTKIAQAPPTRSLRASAALLWDVNLAQIKRPDVRPPELDQLGAAMMVRATKPT